MPFSFLMKLNIANKITLFRVLVIPLFMFFFIVDGKANEFNYFKVLAWFIFILASLSDILDGYYARNYEKVTKFGKLIDPIADKLLVTAALLCLVEKGIVKSWVAFLMIGRDIAVSGLRIIAAMHGNVISASPLGKWKTILQLIAIITALTFFSFDEFLKIPSLANIFELNLIKLYKFYEKQIIDTLMYISAFVSLVSGYDYFQKNKHMIKD